MNKSLGLNRQDNINNNIDNMNINNGDNNYQKDIDLKSKNENYNFKDESDIIIEDETCFHTYISFLKKKQLIYFTFILKDDYNSKAIKICLFLFSLSSDYAINALFFDDSTMHKLHKDKGKFILYHRLLNSFLSFAISHAISKLISFWILSEKNIKKIIEGNKNKTNDRINKLPRKYKIKIVFFFIFLILFLLVFWYYLSSFCTVYKNTQIPLLENTGISILFSLLIYPFIFGLILCPIILHCTKGNNKIINYLYDILSILGDIFI